ncbi:MAG: DUF5050 domain-containing protein [Propionibacteriaceae bacterium]|nr:DUF5050 domain-containing protein [Propionibacteriaceae bacterium]
MKKPQHLLTATPISIMMVLALAFAGVACTSEPAAPPLSPSAQPIETKTSTPDPTPEFVETLDTEQDAALLGNTYGVIAHRGYLVKIGDDYMRRWDHLNQKGVLKRTVNDFHSHYNVSGSTLYYLAESEDDNRRADKIRSIKADGKNNKTIFTVPEGDEIISLILSDGWFYYVHSSDRGWNVSVSRVKQDGTGNELIIDTALKENGALLDQRSLCVGKNSLYYLGWMGQLFKAELDGSNPRPLGKAQVAPQTGIVLHGEWVYYIGLEKRNLMRVKTDGTDEMDVVNAEVLSFDFYGDKLFYVDQDINRKNAVTLCMTTKDDGSGKAEVFYTNKKYNPSKVHVLGDAIYIDASAEYFYTPKGKLIMKKEDFFGNFSLK